MPVIGIVFRTAKEYFNNDLEEELKKAVQNPFAKVFEILTIHNL